MLNVLLDLLFPPRCAGCWELIEGGLFCRACAQTLVEADERRCGRCAEPMEEPGLCDACRQAPPAFDRAEAPFLFGGALADAVHRLKYEDKPQLAGRLAALFGGEGIAWKGEIDLIAPVPLHPERRRQRGYDQALLLARRLGKRWGVPVEAQALSRVRETRPQVGRDRAGRRENVRGAFEGSSALLEGKRLLLVDDVITTGATASAAAQAAKKAGAVCVRVIALGRAP